MAGVDKLHHALDRLPQHRQRLSERLLRDQALRAICEDYGEAAEAQRRWAASGDPASRERVAEFGRLMQELEAEILAALDRPL